jgi:hypothetical protein
MSVEVPCHVQGQEALVLGRLATAQDFQRKGGSMWILSEAETQPASMRRRKPREWILNSVNSLEVTEK